MPTAIDRSAFVPPHHPILRKQAESVPYSEFRSSNLRVTLDRMREVALGEQGDASKPLLVGLAAPQIGISKRIILVDFAADGKGKVGDLRTLINPHIVWSSTDLDRWYEGCYSTGCVCGIVHRPKQIKVNWFNIEGWWELRTFTGYTARIIQHEIDHLNGMEFVDRIHDEYDLHWVERAQFAEYRNNEGWRTWPHRCTRAQWEEIKKGPV